MSIVNLNDLSLEEINGLLEEAIAFKQGKKVDYHQEKVIANLFFEPSTRTHYSFDMAAGNLGCRTQNFEASNSSLTKGETLGVLVNYLKVLGVVHLLFVIIKMITNN